MVIVRLLGLPGVLSSDQLLPGLRLHLAILLQPDGVDADEACRVAGLKVPDFVHARLAHVIQLLGLGRAAQDAEGAFVTATADLPVDACLRGRDAGLEVLALGREVEAVVKELGKLRSAGWHSVCKFRATSLERTCLGVVERDELVPQRPNLPIHDQSL